MSAPSCPACGQVMPNLKRAAELTPGELDALSAWWHMGSVKRAADLLSRAERTVANQLYKARIRNDVHTTLELAQMYFGSLRSMGDLLTQHNSTQRKVA